MGCPYLGRLLRGAPIPKPPISVPPYGGDAGRFFSEQQPRHPLIRAFLVDTLYDVSVRKVTGPLPYRRPRMRSYSRALVVQFAVNEQIVHGALAPLERLDPMEQVDLDDGFGLGTAVT